MPGVTEEQITAAKQMWNEVLQKNCKRSTCFVDLQEAF